ncbi:MAG: pilus assembly protein N-terminal domain-containing protein [Thermoguttaceae bacterium]|jgi:pilus assembly protein CpaC|nr:pilus assembly protein N-terminal domain-containing protein [Thermoguttaceae bacterium]
MSRLKRPGAIDGSPPSRKGNGCRAALTVIGALAALVIPNSLCWAQEVPAAPLDRQAVSVWQAQEDALIAGMVDSGKVMQIDPRFSKLVKTKRPVTRVSVTNPSVLEIVQFGPTEFELIGGQTGSTTLTFWIDCDDEGCEILRYLVQVSPDEAVEERREIEYRVLERKLNELFPNSRIQLIPIADKLIIRGQARDAEEAARILAIVRGQSGEETNYGRARVVQGTAASPFPGTSELPASSVINMLQVPGEMQVLLKVRVAELNRTALRRMGSEFNIYAGDFTFESLLGWTGAVQAVLETNDVRFMLEALSTNGYSKILAEPNLVTLSGHPAYFLAGGEFAVPVVVGVEGAAAATTNFRSFGTQLAFTPTVLDKDRIRLHVTPSISSLNEENAVEGIPGLDTRAVTTTVDLRTGQWLAIAGLLQDQQSGSKARVPFLGDVPVLDSFFSRKEVRREETELIVLVSPELVHPLEAEEAPQILPGMEVTEPGDMAFFISGSIEGRPNCDHRSTIWPNVQREIIRSHLSGKRQISYQQSESYYIQGEHGFSQ